MTIPPQNPSPILRIGVDVGGTNTDSVIVDLTPGAQQIVLAAHKSPTTPDVTHGIQSAVQTTLSQITHSRKTIQALSIGTTSFVNALISRDEKRLEKVAVIRLCGPFSRGCPPFAGFPYELRDILEGPTFFVDGGLQIDGSEIVQINEREILGVAEQIKRQEYQTMAILQKAIPGIFTTCSRDVANIGLLERENATILNAALLPFAQKTIRSFKRAAKVLGLTCPVFITSNDGTILTCDSAARFPIRTVSSGPTNSMRGAAFLASGSPRTALVVDVGGTTTEVGVLLPTGFPRQAAAHHEFCGVKLNFSMPHVTSIGLGGGSIVKDGKVGPASVGYKITEEAICFGGSTLTASDVVAPEIGTHSVDLDKGTREHVMARIKEMLEITLDSMKTSAEPLPAYMVGGGSIIAPTSMNGISEVIRFPHAECANAVGAAIAQVSGVVDSVEDVANRPMAQVRKEVEQRAIKKAIASGANPTTVIIVESEAIPIAYTAGRCRFYVKAAGEWQGVVASEVPSDSMDEERLIGSTRTTFRHDQVWNARDILSYRPKVEKQVWTVSEIDLEWIATGTFILGCGGGGDPSHIFLQLREMVRQGQEIHVVDLSYLPEDALVGWGGGMGSPEVASERLIGDEYVEATQELQSVLKLKTSALAALEIGGSNGMVNMTLSPSLGLPVVDGDFMGRAYPTGWQVTPNVFNHKMLPTCIASGDGNVIFQTKAKVDRDIDRCMRAACCEMGTHVGQAFRPQSVGDCRSSLIKNTVSLSWRLGRAVALANKQANVSQVGKIVTHICGGRVLFAGKIVEVSRRIYKGHTVGEVVIEAIQDEPQYQGVMKIPFKNENLVAELNGKISACVPDLISLLDAQSGHNLGTPDYKFGQRVLVLAVPCAPQWRTPRGLELGGPASFDMDNVEYQPVGEYMEPKSVIEEYDQSS